MPCGNSSSASSRIGARAFLGRGRDRDAPKATAMRAVAAFLFACTLTAPAIERDGDDLTGAHDGHQ